MKSHLGKPACERKGHLNFRYSRKDTASLEEEDGDGVSSERTSGPEMQRKVCGGDARRQISVARVELLKSAWAILGCHMIIEQVWTHTLIYLLLFSAYTPPSNERR